MKGSFNVSCLTIFAFLSEQVEDEKVRILETIVGYEIEIPNVMFVVSNLFSLDFNAEILWWNNNLIELILSGTVHGLIMARTSKSQCYPK